MNKKVIVVLVASFLCLLTFDANALYILIKTKKGDICIATGQHKGDCDKGIAFNGNEKDFTIEIDGRPIRASRISVDAGNISSFTTGENSVVNVSVTDGYSKRKKFGFSKKLNERSKRTSLSNIVIKNKKTGEIISLNTILQIRSSELTFNSSSEKK